MNPWKARHEGELCNPNPFVLEGSVEGHEKLGDIYPQGDERQNIVSSGVVLKNMTPFLHEVRFPATKVEGSLNLNSFGDAKALPHATKLMGGSGPTQLVGRPSQSHQDVGCCWLVVARQKLANTPGETWWNGPGGYVKAWQGHGTKEGRPPQARPDQKPARRQVEGRRISLTPLDAVRTVGRV